MNRILKGFVLSLTAFAITLSVLPAAQAGDNWRRHHHRNGDLVAAGVLGLAVGAIAAGIATGPREVYVEDDYYEPVYRNPRPRPHPNREYIVRQPNVAYYGGLEPWSVDWYEYCDNRYRSFDPETGTFMGYDGQRRFCVAN